MNDPLTWTCMVCGTERADPDIRVAYRPIKGFEEAFPHSRTNVRYCRDNPDCIDWALGNHTPNGRFDPWEGPPP